MQQTIGIQGDINLEEDEEDEDSEEEELNTDQDINPIDNSTMEGAYNN